MAVRRVGSDVRLETQRATTARGTRNPIHNWMGSGMVDHRLYPVCFSPVLAGDTLVQASVQGRVIGALQSADNVRGSWFEHWLFYVRVGDMPNAEAIRQLIIDPEADAPINWRDECMNAIWKAYFMDEDDGSTYEGFLRATRSGWWDSARDAEELPDPGAETDEWKVQWMRYEAMRRAKLTTNTFEEYLAKSGVNVPPQLRVDGDPEMKIPELIQYSREFVYPQLSVAPTGTGSTQTVQWMIQDRLKRSRFCGEPGFIVMCAAVRPKVYPLVIALEAEEQVQVDPLQFLNKAEGWLPPDFDTDPHTSLVEVPTVWFDNEDTVEGAAHVVDVRDLYLNGFDEIGSHSGSLTSVKGVVQVTDPKAGVRPEGTLLAYSADFRVGLGFKSRVSKDTTR